MHESQRGGGAPKAPRPLLVVTAAGSSETMDAARFSNSVVAARFPETLAAARFPETLAAARFPNSVVAAHASDSVRELAPLKTVVAAGSSEDVRPR